MIHDATWTHAIILFFTHVAAMVIGLAIGALPLGGE